MRVCGNKTKIKKTQNKIQDARVGKQNTKLKNPKQNTRCACGTLSHKKPKNKIKKQNKNFN